ncbi:hypothetical protein MBRU_04140 [Mycolicibacterium brumae DSM 44177]|nr:hypothetical protein MBRU_04140 [Mycolicibacterium brumae DSM 44177]
MSVLVAGVARRIGWSSPLVLVAVGLAATLIPGMPHLVLDSNLVLFVILPPLLWTAGLESSYLDLRKNFGAVSNLAVLLPLGTTAVVGLVAYHTVPELTPAAALVLGAIVAPPDAVSATSIGRKLGLPRRLMTLIGGESLLNDATSLTAYKVSLAAAIGVTQSWGHAVETFLLAVAGGIVVGVIAGKLLVAIRSRMEDAVSESAIGLVAPFVCYLVGEEIHGSGVLAVVVASLIVGQRSTGDGYATRLQDAATWRSVQLVLESFAFLLIGLQLPQVVEQLSGLSALMLITSAAAVFATVLAVRIAWVFAFAALSPTVRRVKPGPAELFVVAWAGMRGVVSLAAAAAVPVTTLAGDPFPGRPNIIFLTFVVVIGTLLLHGLTLPWVIRRFDISADDPRADDEAVAAARLRALDASDRRLEKELNAARTAGKPMHVYEETAEALRMWNARRRVVAESEALEPTEEMGPEPSAVYRKLRLRMLAAEREALIATRDENLIDDEVLRELMQDLDLREAALDR